jgi:Fe-S cluster biosynthesis and repair protein YggX
MLFDLRGRGRRSTVKVIYIGLAALFLLGFVGLGVGGGFGSTGILSSLTGEGEGGGGNTYAKQVSKYRKLTAKQPGNVSAWGNLAKSLYHEAGAEPNTTSTGEVTSKGKALFKQVSQAWNRYIALNPPKPDAELAQLMENVYGEAGLDEPSKEVEVLQIAIQARPTDATLYADLAVYSYRAHNTRQGDLASEKALALTPASERKRLQHELAEYKANPSGEKTFTTTTNGKTYTGKLNSKGELHATEVKTSSTATKPSSGKTKK